VLGESGKDDAAAALSGDDGVAPLGEFQVDATSAQTHEDGRHSVDVTYTQFAYQFVAARWSFVERGSDLLLDDETLLLPEPEVDFVTVISATVGAEEGATIAFDQSTSVPATDAIVLHLINNSTTDRDFVVVSLPAGTTLDEDGTLPDDLADVRSMLATDEATLAGYSPVAAGGIVDMALVGLPPGIYALIDLTDATAVPLTVTVPAA
jgi:hypothetical protein